MPGGRPRRERRTPYGMTQAALTGRAPRTVRQHRERPTLGWPHPIDSRCGVVGCLLGSLMANYWVTGARKSLNQPAAVRSSNFYASFLSSDAPVLLPRWAVCERGERGPRTMDHGRG